MLNYKKFANTVLYLLRHRTAEPPGLLALMKMIWFVDYWHYKEHLRLVTGGSYVALPNGPALNNYEQLFARLEKDGIVSRRKLKIFGQPKQKIEFRAKAEADETQFTDTELAVLAEVIRKCGHLPGNALCAMTHREGPWQLVWTGRSGQPIYPILFRWLENLPTDHDIELAKQKLARPEVMREVQALIA